MAAFGWQVKTLDEGLLASIRSALKTVKVQHCLRQSFVV
jgi:hypothetical protein